MVAPNRIFFTRNFVTTRGIEIELGKRHCYRSPNALPFTYLFQEWRWERCPAGYILEIAKSIRGEVLRNLPKPIINDSTLVVHLRAWDSFNEHPTPHGGTYGQPTCNFYSDIIRRRDLGHDSVLAVGKDDLHVCTKMCGEMGAKFQFGASLAADFAVMLYAKRLMMSRSTIMRAVMYLSPVWKVWYYFGSAELIDCGLDDWPWHLWSVFGPHQVCIPSRDFEINVVMNWTRHKSPYLLKETCKWYMDTTLMTESGRDTIRKVWVA
jgi:hypothetical protein